MTARSWVLALGVFAFAVRGFSPAASGQERRVIDGAFPGGYQVEIADVNGDNRPDIIALGGDTLAWYENPTWKKRIVTGPRRAPGVISSATIDLNGDGKAEIAIAYDFIMKKPSSGKLAIAYQGSTPDKDWKLLEIPVEGNVHRLRWGDIDGDGRRRELVAAPIFARDSQPPVFEGAAEVRVFDISFDARSSKGNAAASLSAGSIVVAHHPVVHAIEVIDVDGDGKDDLLTASNDGVDLLMSANGTPITLTPGAPGEAPRRGSSEVHLGRLADGRRFLATVEPWHGSMVAICFADGKTGAADAKGAGPPHFGPRTVIDDTLDDGHALWVADVDGDGDDEVLAGHRGKDHRVSLYDFDRDGKTWKRTVLDHDIAAQDLRGGDLDGDGAPDVVAIGGSTHNVVWYHFKKPSGNRPEKEKQPPR